MKKNQTDYTVSDLSRALLRQFLSQKGLKSTLQAFEKEDTNNKKKINKNVLIEMTSMKNLFLMNKNAIDSENTLLEILISYLHKKYKAKNYHSATIQPNIFKQNFIDTYEEKKDAQNPKNKPRITSNKEIKKPQHLQKEELKNIYQKLQKVEESKPFQPKIAPSVKKIQNNSQKISIASEKQSKIQNPIQKQIKIIEEVPINQHPKVIQMDEQYQEHFQQEQIPKGKSQNLNQIKKTILMQQQLRIIHEQSLQETHKSIKTTAIKDESSEHQSKKEQTMAKQQKIQELFNKDTRQRENGKLAKSNSQEQFNPMPIVHILQSEKQIQSNNKGQFKVPLMGACIEKVENVGKKNLQQQAEMAPKSRSQMMKIAKKQEGSLKVQQTIKPQSKQEIAQIKKAESVQNKSEIKLVKGPAVPQKQTIVASVVPVPVMVSIGKKKKNKQQSNDQHYPTKFKFDENFTHEIPKEITYEYKPYNFQSIVIDEKAEELYPWIILSSKINYKQKGGGVNPLKKRVEKIISSKDAQRLKQIVFKSASPILPKAWHQGFVLSQFQQTPYGLKQIQGGPCGIIAALQCYYLKHLLHCSKQTTLSDQILRQVSLVAAIANVLWKVKSSDKFILAFPPKNAAKVDINNLKTLSVEVSDFQSAFAAIWNVREEYIGINNHGVTSLLFTCVLTRGFEKIQEEIDNKQNPLIGLHGHCTQEFVNMLLTGRASSNCFDGDKLIDDYKIKGINQKSQFGFLTIFETLKYIQVGKNLKNPIFPVWVICKEFHYHVIFAPHYLISQQNKSEKFDIVYFDGLYNCGDRIRMTLQNLKSDEQDNVKLKDLPLIQQVMMTKWGRKNVNWNGSTKIL